jgi:hypothetical protein
MAGVGTGGSDSSIRDDVQFELKWDPKMTSNTYPLELHNWASAEGELRDIGVTAKDGVLTLSGYVSSYWEKDAAKPPNEYVGCERWLMIFKSGYRIPELTRKSQKTPFTSLKATFASQAKRSKRR